MISRTDTGKFRVAIVIDSVPSYRRGFYKRLLANPDIQLTVYCQSHVRGVNLNLIHKELGDNFIEIPFISTDQQMCAFQFLPVIFLWRNFDVIFFLGNARIISTLIWATLFRLLGKKIVIWGQTHTAGANRFTEAIRMYWWRLFDYFLVYTDIEAKRLKRRRGFANKQILGMNNGLDQDEIELVRGIWTERFTEKWRFENGLEGKTILLSCARLEKKNRFDLMINALANIVKHHPNAIWCVIGQGSEFANLKQIAEHCKVDNHIVWAGEVYCEENLAPWFLSATVLVHPGAIGLTLMHAFGYGLPVVTHNNLNFQMPEIGAFRNGVNGWFFEENDVQSLTERITSFIHDSRQRMEMSKAALETVQTSFNCNQMADRFSTIAKIAINS